MRKYLLLGIACLLYGFAQAQEKEKTVELGFNSLYLFQHIAKLGQSNPVLVKNYGFSLKKINGKHAFRMALGVDYTREGGREISDLIEANRYFASRFGYEGRRNLHERVTAMLGIDLMYHRHQVKEPDFRSFFPHESFQIGNNNLIGGGFFFGIEFKINDRISLTTESGLSYLHSVFISKRKLANGNVLFKQKSKSFEFLRFSFPTSIYFAIKFNRQKDE